MRIETAQGALARRGFTDAETASRRVGSWTQHQLRLLDVVVRAADPDLTLTSLDRLNDADPGLLDRLVDDPALAGMRITPGKGRRAAAVTELQDLLREDGVRHDGGKHLRTQVLSARTQLGSDGPRVVSQTRTDALKAAVWVAAKCRRPGPGSMRILLPKSAQGARD